MMSYTHNMSVSSEVSFMSSDVAMLKCRDDIECELSVSHTELYTKVSGVTDEFHEMLVMEEWMMSRSVRESDESFNDCPKI